MRSILAIAAIAISLAFTADTQAQNCCGGFRAGLPYHGFGYSGSLYGLGYIPVPPYYAIHPPVYYSHQISRSYGDSPYAYAPQRPAPRPRPQVIMNPYAPQTQQTADESAEKVAAAKMITNPFYHAGEGQIADTGVQLNPYAAAEVDLAKSE